MDLKRIIQKREALNKAKYMWRKVNPNYKQGGTKYIYGYQEEKEIPKKDTKDKVEAKHSYMGNAQQIVDKILHMRHIDRDTINMARLRRITGDKTLPTSVRSDEDFDKVVNKVISGLQSGKISLRQMWTFIHESGHTLYNMDNAQKLSFKQIGNKLSQMRSNDTINMVRMRRITGDKTLPTSIRSDRDFRKLQNKVQQGLESGKIKLHSMWRFIRESGHSLYDK